MTERNHLRRVAIRYARTLKAISREKSSCARAYRIDGIDLKNSRRDESRLSPSSVARANDAGRFSANAKLCGHAGPTNSSV